MVPKQGGVGWVGETSYQRSARCPWLKKKINPTINNKVTFFTNFKSLCKFWWDGDLSGTWDSSEEELLCCSVWLRQQCLGAVLRGKLSWELENRKQMKDTEPKFNLYERQPWKAIVWLWRERQWQPEIRRLCSGNEVTKESLKKSGREFKTSWNHIKKQAQLTKNLWDTVKTVLYEDIATNAYS